MSTLGELTGISQCRRLAIVAASVLVTSLLAADERPSGQALRTNERPGKIYLRAFLKNKGPQAKKEFAEGIFVVDPQTGAWRSLLDHGISPRVSPDGETLVLRYRVLIHHGNPLQAQVADVYRRFAAEK